MGLGELTAAFRPSPLASRAKRVLVRGWRHEVQYCDIMVDYGTVQCWRPWLSSLPGSPQRHGGLSRSSKSYSGRFLFHRPVKPPTVYRGTLRERDPTPATQRHLPHPACVCGSSTSTSRTGIQRHAASSTVGSQACRVLRLDTQVPRSKHPSAHSRMAAAWLPPIAISDLEMCQLSWTS